MEKKERNYSSELSLDHTWCLESRQTVIIFFLLGYGLEVLNFCGNESYDL